MHLSDLFDLKAKIIADNTYVILVEHKRRGLILVKDPGLDRPWSTQNKKLADSHAADYAKDPMAVKASAVTLSEAFDILQKKFSEQYQAKIKHSRN